MLTREAGCFFEARCDPRIADRPAFRGAIAGRAHDGRELLVGRLRVRRHQVAGGRQTVFAGG